MSDETADKHGAHDAEVLAATEAVLMQPCAECDDDHAAAEANVAALIVVAVKRDRAKLAATVPPMTMTAEQDASIQARLDTRQTPRKADAFALIGELLATRAALAALREQLAAARDVVSPLLGAAESDLGDLECGAPGDEDGCRAAVDAGRAWLGLPPREHGR